MDGIEYTEAQANGFAEAETRVQFDKDEFRLLVVANKYLTGFDQPKLCTMYVDKKLQGVLAVQATDAGSSFHCKSVASWDSQPSDPSITIRESKNVLE